jgi:translation initiation factor IF-2
MAKKIGIVTHWYDKIGVAVITLKGKLSVGDVIRIEKGNDGFEETISSMQLDHKDVSSGKKGEEIAVKMSKKALVGSSVSKVE